MLFPLGGVARRISIRTKLVVAFVLFAGLPVAVVGGAGALHAFVLLNDGLEDRLRSETTLKAEGVRRTVSQAEADVLFLAALPAVRALASNADSPSVATVSEAFVRFARSRPAYDQLRYLDRDGHELVRVEHGAAGPVIVTNVLLAVVVAAGLTSHMPGRFRHASLLTLWPGAARSAALAGVQSVIATKGEPS